MKKIYFKLLKFVLFIPIIPTVAVGFQYGVNLGGYILAYLINIAVLIVGLLILRILLYIFR